MMGQGVRHKSSDGFKWLHLGNRIRGGLAYLILALLARQRCCQVSGYTSGDRIDLVEHAEQGVVVTGSRLLLLRVSVAAGNETTQISQRFRRVVLIRIFRLIGRFSTLSLGEWRLLV